MFLRCFRPKFHKKIKSTLRYMKIRLDIVRRRRIAMVNISKTDIVNLLERGQDHNAFKRAEVLLEELRILSCYDLIERFCDCISENLSLLRKKRECPEECREAVSSLIYAAAWVPDVPELKDLRAVFMRRFGSFIDSYVNHELVEKTELRRPPSRELRIHTVKDIAKEFLINWDPTALTLLLLKKTSALQIEGKVETKVDDPNLTTEKSLADDHSEDESILSESWRRDPLSKDGLSSSSSSSSLGRNSVEKKKKKKKKEKRILPYGIISPPHTKPGDQNYEKAQDGKKENSRFLRLQGSDKEASSTRENEKTLSFQTPKLLDYDEVVARLAALRRR